MAAKLLATGAYSLPNPSHLMPVLVCMANLESDCGVSKQYPNFLTAVSFASSPIEHSSLTHFRCI